MKKGDILIALQVIESEDDSHVYAKIGDTLEVVGKTYNETYMKKLDILDNGLRLIFSK